ncbi:MAG: hypothetical protein WC052_02415 [Patescibacteria group bacterium]
MPTVEHIMGSRESLRLLKFFLFHPEETFTFAQLRRRMGASSLRDRRTLRVMVVMKAIIQEGLGEAATFRVNTDWLLYPEFRALFVKAQLLVERDLIDRLQRSGAVSLLILAGLFVGDPAAATDILIVGRVNTRSAARYLRAFEQDIGRELNYTILSVAEFKYRKNVGDRFLYAILEKPHLVVVDAIERPIAKKVVAKHGSRKRKK